MSNCFWTPIEIPDGQYEGTWTGYTLNFTHDARRVTVTSLRPSLGINIAVRFRVVDGKVDDESIDPLPPSFPAA